MNVRLVSISAAIELDYAAAAADVEKLIFPVGERPPVLPCEARCPASMPGGSWKRCGRRSIRETKRAAVNAMFCIGKLQSLASSARKVVPRACSKCNVLYW